MSGTLTKDALTEQTQHFELPCGCEITESPDESSIAWCPHHEMLHGVIPLRPAVKNVRYVKH